MRKRISNDDEEEEGSWLILAERVEMSVVAEGIDSRFVAKLCRRKV
jgi:hypothetical protein